MAEPDHADEEYRDEGYLHVNSEDSSIVSERGILDDEHDIESVAPRGVLSHDPTVSLDMESLGSQLSGGQRNDIELKAVEHAEMSAQKPAPRKRQASTDQEEGTTSQKKLHKRRKAQPKSGVEISLLKKSLLTYSEKEAMQIFDYGEEEMAEFEEVRKKFKECDEARFELGVSVCRATLGKHEVPIKHRKKPRSPVDDATSTSGDSAPYKNNEGTPVQDVSCPPGGSDQIETAAQDETAAQNEGAPAEDLQEGAKRWKMPTGDYKPIPLDKELAEALKKSLKTPPRFLYRASSWEGIKRTNGYDHIALHVPAAHMNDDEKCHESIYDIPNGLCELAEMLGHRFLWSDRRRDETLSWTSSLLFAIVHASGRLAKGQRGVAIHTIDTTKVKTLDGCPVEFHFAPDLLRILEIQSYKCWDFFQLTNLRQPWYTHEWVSHHVVKSPLRHSHEADIAELIDKGLYSFVSSLKTQEDDDMRSLYHRCCYSRSVEHAKHGSVKSITTEDLNKARDLAMSFLSPQTRSLGVEPPLHFLIDFLGLTARPKTDPVFIEWIQKRYNAEDLQKSAYENMIRIPNNTPELAQALELARDACVALELPGIPGTRVWMADPDFNWYCKWLQPLCKRIKIKDRKRTVKLPSQNKGMLTAPKASAQGSSEGGEAAAKEGEESQKDDSVHSLAAEQSGDANQEESHSGFSNGTDAFSPDVNLGDGDELEFPLSTDEDGHSTRHDDEDSGSLP
ncbi:hypothetical protein KC360_g4823 [Hortaea werneckii]|nr:hypothetical protein KC325_g4775 [Hortaea werneckii]KAI6992776.1 hypothetical protein KC359_g5504 [Hortaea werneckii]KAI7145163.1 hypothetical protein KC344_g4743 [Hortaea werneckii]KAI7173545.1 hypothetical protein KC360_g4823 [Hortaea werneckii]